MTREFNPIQAGITPENVQDLYHIVLTQKLTLEAKIDRVKKEMAIASCEIEKGNVDPEQVRVGLLNLIYYLDVKCKPELELDVEKGSIELVNHHLEWAKKEILAKHSNQPTQ